MTKRKRPESPSSNSRLDKRSKTSGIASFFKKVSPPSTERRNTSSSSITLPAPVTDHPSNQVEPQPDSTIPATSAMDSSSSNTLDPPSRTTVNEHITVILSDSNFMELKMQSKSFLHHTGIKSLHGAAAAYKNMSSQERSLYPQVFRLIRILLVCPVSAATCERSFSVLRC